MCDSLLDFTESMKFSTQGMLSRQMTNLMELILLGYKKNVAGEIMLEVPSMHCRVEESI